MDRNFKHTNPDSLLPSALRELDAHGKEITSRAGVVKELTHVGITLNKPWQRELTLPERKPNLAAQVVETMWVLAGRDDIGLLEHYLPRVRDFSDDGETWRAGYGARLRGWPGPLGGESVDQLRYVVDLLKRDRGTRQAVMSIWDPVEDTEPGKDIPCNNWLHFLSREGYLDLHVAIRSNDIIWGWSGINQFEWSTLLEVVAALTGNMVGSLHFSISSLHIYDKHWAKSEKIRKARPGVTHPEDSPRFTLEATLDGDLDAFDRLLARWFELEKEIRAGHLNEAAVNEFPEPMMQSWLRVLQWWWSVDKKYMAPLAGTRLYESMLQAVQPKREKPVERGSAMIEYAIKTHNEKHAAYGDSWKRRGEMLGIMANIARKVDRLGGVETSDETSFDTAMDLMVYLAKYRVWLRTNAEGTPFDDDPSDFPDAANDVMRHIERRVKDDGQPVDSRGYEEGWLRTAFDELEKRVVNKGNKIGLINDMLTVAFVLAQARWADRDEYRGADADAVTETSWDSCYANSCALRAGHASLHRSAGGRWW